MTVLQKFIFDIETGEDSYSATELIHKIEAYFPAEEQQIRDAFEAGERFGMDLSMAMERAEEATETDLETYLTHLKTKA